MIRTGRVVETHSGPTAAMHAGGIAKMLVGGVTMYAGGIATMLADRIATMLAGLTAMIRTGRIAVMHTRSECGIAAGTTGAAVAEHRQRYRLIDGARSMVGAARLIERPQSQVDRPHVGRNDEQVQEQQKSSLQQARN